MLICLVYSYRMFKISTDNHQQRCKKTTRLRNEVTVRIRTEINDNYLLYIILLDYLKISSQGRTSVIPVIHN